MTTPKHLKIQTLLAFLLTLGGYLVARYYYTPSYGITLYHAAPLITGAIWLISVVFFVWWRKP